MLKGLRLGDHCEKIGSGATPRGGKEGYLSEGPYSLIRSQNVHNHGFEFSGLAFIDEDQARKLRNVAVQIGDVLFNITGDSVARACRVHPDALPARVNQHVAIVRPRPNEIDPLFLRYWLVSPDTQVHLLALASAGATRNALTKAMLEGLRLPALPLEVQRSIGSTLSSLDDKIELNQRTSETLEKMAQAIFRDWFFEFGPTRRKADGATDPVEIMGGLVSDPERARQLAVLFPPTLGDDELPVGWTLGDLSRYAVLNSESWNTRNPPRQLEYVDLGNTKWGVIESTTTFSWDNAPSRARRVVRAGDTIVGTVRPGNGSYSFVGVDGLTASTGFAVLRPKAASFGEFIYCSATSKDNIDRLG
jgi:type I restriction enzyme S subunit